MDTESVRLALADSREEVGDPEEELVATKAYDALDVAERLRDLGFRHAVFVQNGLGVLEHAERLLRELREGGP